MKSIRLGTYVGKDSSIRKVVWVGLDFGVNGDGELVSHTAVKYESETSPHAKTIKESSFLAWVDKLIKEAGVP